MKRIYLDYCASTPVDPSVLGKMQPFFSEEFANPSSQHQAGWSAQRAIEKARSQVAELLHARLPKEIVFTSGASEANALALVGYIQWLRLNHPNRSLHALTAATEHKSVLETFHQFQELGVEIEILPTNSYGQVEISTIQKHLRPETVLMSFMWANNELGSINPIEKISRLAKQHNICLHSDATQACGKIELDLQTTPVDLLSLSGHKMYAPKGVGALYLRHEGARPAVNLWPLVRGGTHEGGLRAGTLNVPGIVGLGEAADLAKNAFVTEIPELKSKTLFFLNELRRLYPNLVLNGHHDERIPGHLHLTFPGIRWDQWLPRLSHLCVSTTSACSAEAGHGSHVLKALGFDDSSMRSSLRISLGKFTSETELKMALELFQRVFNQP